MNDDIRLERDVASCFSEMAPSRGPDDLLDDVFLTTGRMRPRPRWLAFIKEPPMRHSTHLAVGSPTVRVAAILAATLLISLVLAGAGIAGTRLLAADPIVVAQDGSGTVETITEAVARAADGEMILVRPGTYVEAVVIENGITLLGDGPIDEVILEAPEDGPTYAGFPRDAYSILLRDADESMISGLTFRGEGSTVIVASGSSTIKDSVFDGVGWAFGTGGASFEGSSIHLNEAASATITGNSLVAGGPVGVFGDSVAVVSDNLLSGGPHIVLNEFGAGTAIEGNTIDGTLRWAIAVADDDRVEITGNTITDPGDIGINDIAARAILVEGNRVSGASQTGVMLAAGAGTVRGNVIDGNGTGIQLLGATLAGEDGADISDNELTGNRVGISVAAPDATVQANVIADGHTGIIVVSGGSPMISDNSVDVSGKGVIIGRGTSPFVSGNSICGGATDFDVADDVEVDLSDNALCGARATS